MLCCILTLFSGCKEDEENPLRFYNSEYEVPMGGRRYLGLEIGRRNDLAHVKASFVGAARISHPRQFLFASYCKRVCSTVHQIVTVRSMNLDIPDIFAR